MTQSPAQRGPSVDVDQAYRVLVGICLVLAGGVVLAAGGAWAVLEAGLFPPFLGFPAWVRWSVGAGLLVLLAASYPAHRAAGGAVAVTDAATALQAFQTRVITAMAMREFVGMAGAVLILLSRDLLVGGTLAGLAVLSILLALPRREDLREAVRRAG
ncbi:MAG: hypothetical protein RQ751_01525 [Longimicrobiales bacterium]|nr:hypothetical protein [Longimicrobiales bacterium]